MNIHARISKEWRQRMIFMAMMLNGSGLWFCYDGFIAWPAQEQNYQRLVTLTAGTLAGEEKPTDKNPNVVRAWATYAAANKLPEKIPKHRSPGDLSGQRTIGSIFMFIGLTFIGWVVLQHRRSVRADGDIITGANGVKVHLDSIIDMDRRKWVTKGIAYALYEENGKKHRLCLDDHKFAGCEAIIKEAESRIAARNAAVTPPIPG